MTVLRPGMVAILLELLHPRAARSGLGRMGAGNCRSGCAAISTLALVSSIPPFRVTGATLDVLEVLLHGGAELYG